MVVSLRFVKADINSLLLMFFLELVVVSGSEGVDINNTSVSEDLVVD